MTMYLFKASIRGNVKREDEDALQTEIAEQLATIPYFTLTENAVQVWEKGDGELYEYTGSDGEVLHLYTITIAGDIYAESEAAVRAIVSAFCEAYPDFVLVYRRIKATGIAYVEPTETTEDETESDEEEVTVEVEEVTESTEV